MLTNMNESNRKAFENVTIYSSKFSQEKMNEIRRFQWRTFKNGTLKRGFFRAVSLMGDSGLSDPKKIIKWKQLKIEMSRIFSSAKITLNGNEAEKIVLPLEPNITALFSKSRDYNHLVNIWRLWRDNSGKKFRHLYPEFIELSNEATREYGFKDYGEYLRSNFETNNLDEQFDVIYTKIEKLYRLLHSYTKKKLIEMYPGRIDDHIGPLPSHVFGDNWAQQWHNIFEDIKPYKNKPLLDVTNSMLEKVMIYFSKD